MSDYLVQVVLYVHVGCEAAFWQFEAKALALLERHQGRLLRAFRTADGAGGEDHPFEVHLLSFPSERNFRDFRSDPEILALARNRSTFIARTEVLAGVDCTAALLPAVSRSSKDPPALSAER